MVWYGANRVETWCCVRVHVLGLCVWGVVYWRGVVYRCDVALWCGVCVCLCLCACAEVLPDSIGGGAVVLCGVMCCGVGSGVTISCRWVEWRRASVLSPFGFEVQVVLLRSRTPFQEVIRRGALRCGEDRCGAMRCGAVWCSTVRSCTVRCGAGRCGVVR